MTAIYDWIKNITYLYIFITTILHLLPNQDYRKYVRFFASMLLVVLLITPVVNIIYNKDYLTDKISFESFWQEMENIKLDVDKMEDIQKNAFKNEYEKAIGEDIKLMANDQEIFVHQIDVKLTDEYTVESVKMSVDLNQEDGIYVEKILSSDNSVNYPEVKELRDKIKTFYKIKEDQIQIIVKED